LYRRRAFVPALIGCLVAAWLISPGTASAATVRNVATTGADTGDCTVNPCRTIQYAIGQSSSGDVIKIAAGTYSENVVIDRSLAVKGAGASSTMIDGSAAGTVVTIGSPSASLRVIVSKLTIQNGHAATGAGISSVPGTGETNTVSLFRVVVSNNVATSAGGGIYNAVSSTMHISRSSVSGNSAYAQGGSAAGGGIDNAGTIFLTKTAVSGNHAIALVIAGGVASGGGLSNIGRLNITQSTVSANSAVVMNQSEHGSCREQGGGIFGSGTIVNSTVANNSVPISFSGPCNFTRVGGGIEAAGTISLVNSTIADNSAATAGGGLDLTNGSASLTNSILARNTASIGPDCQGTVSSGGHNLVGNDSSCSGFTGAGDLRNVHPVLGPLQNNGGPTFTIALLPGSPAIGAADDAVCAAPPIKGVDQRGKPRPSGPHCDIGSFELQK
jgi:hypothetical protein